MPLSRQERKILLDDDVQKVLFDAKIDEITSMLYVEEKDKETVISKKSQAEKLEALTQLIIQSMNSLDSFVQPLGAFGETYKHIIDLIEDKLTKQETEMHKMALRPKSYVSERYRGPTLWHPTNINTAVRRALVNRLPISAISQRCYYIPKYSMLLYCEHPKLSQYSFPTMEHGIDTFGANFTMVADSGFQEFLDTPIFQHIRSGTVLFLSLDSIRKVEMPPHEPTLPTSEHPILYSRSLSLELNGNQEEIINVNPLMKTLSNMMMFNSLFVISTPPVKVTDLALAFKDVKMEHAVNNIHLKGLHVPELNGKHFGQVLFNYKNCQELDLYHTRISSQALLEVVKVLKDTLIALGLSSEPALRESGVFREFCQSIQGAKKLYQLTLKDNDLEDEQLIELCNVASTVIGLRKIILAGNRVSEEMINTIKGSNELLTVTVLQR